MNPDSSPKTLTRSTSDRWFGGVAGGIAQYFNVDPVLTRVGFVATALFTGGAGILAYLVMLVIMPADDKVPSPPQSPLPV
jgi:phage shock protein PspC (stress-responsive transcriptional regulator)